MDLQIILNTYAKDILRKQADYDYIAARMNYRMKLRQQFLWAGQQAIEKYPKAILLFNGKSSRFYTSSEKEKREFGHDLVALNDEVKSIQFLKYELPAGSDNFLKYLTDFGGRNRYMSRNSYNTSNVLYRFDELTWSIRRYCQYIPDRGLGCKEPTPGLKEAYVSFINAPEFKKNTCRFKIMGGELENILGRSHSDKARQALIWANLFYGTRTRRNAVFSPMAGSEVSIQNRSWFPKDKKDLKTLEHFIKF